jgi:cytochrome c-type biogenesis protein CcmH
MRLFMRMLILVAMFSASAVLSPAWAIDPTEELADPEQQALYKSITEEVRCLVCQNNTIADSTAPLAADLRREIRRKIEAGQSESEIKDFLVERYGDFILYKPRFRSWNLVLWLGPAALLVIGLIALSVIVKRRMQLPIDEDAP